MEFLSPNKYLHLINALSLLLLNKSTASGAIYARSSVIFPHRMAFVDAVTRGPKLNLIKKIWGKGGGGNPTTLTVSSLVSEF